MGEEARERTNTIRVLSEEDLLSLQTQGDRRCEDEHLTCAAFRSRHSAARARARAATCDETIVCHSCTPGAAMVRTETHTQGML